MKFEIRESKGKRFIGGVYDHPPRYRYAANPKTVEIFQAPHWQKGYSKDWAKYRYIVRWCRLCGAITWGYIQLPHVKELDKLFAKLKRKRAGGAQVKK